MAQNNIKITGLNKLKSDLAKEVRYIKSKSMQIALEDIKENSPVDTGNLKNSFSINDNKIISSTDYSIIQDKGGQIPVTENMKDKFWALYYSTGREKYKFMALSKQSTFDIKPHNYINENRIDGKIESFFKNYHVTI